MHIGCRISFLQGEVLLYYTIYIKSLLYLIVKAIQNNYMQGLFSSSYNYFKV